MFAFSGLVVALASAYGLVTGCDSCQEASTGMPAPYAKALSVGGVVFGLAMIAASAPWRRMSPARRRWCEAMLLAALALGGALLLGVVAGVYRPCPTCVVVWSAVAISALTLVGTGGQGARLASVALPALVLAAAWTRFDRTTAQGFAELLPRVELSSGCVGDVLTPKDLQELLALGVPENRPVLFVAHCSPSAAATAKRLMEKSPGAKVVAPDATLASVLGRDRLVVYPPLAARAAMLGANVHRVTLREGKVTECRANLTSLD